MTSEEKVLYHEFVGVLKEKMNIGQLPMVAYARLKYLVKTYGMDTMHNVVFEQIYTIEKVCNEKVFQTPTHQWFYVEKIITQNLSIGEDWIV